MEQGKLAGFDAGGRKSVLAAVWPDNFLGGKGPARLYLDDQASPDQRRELEAVFSRQRGGLLEGLMGAVITQWLPAQTARIVVQRRAPDDGARHRRPGRASERPYAARQQPRDAGG